MFHEWVAEEMSKIGEGDIIEPTREINPEKDRLLGEMNGKLRKLFTLYLKTVQVTEAAVKTAREAARKILTELPEEINDTYLEELRKRAGQLEVSIRLARERENLMRLIFWISLRDDFPEVKEESVAVCKGFKVVSFKSTEKPEPQGVFFIPVGPWEDMRHCP